MQDFKKLRVWHLAQTLCLEVNAALPPHKARRLPGLRDQAVRAALSVPANIAEGCTRLTRMQFRHFLEIALGSLAELESHLSLAHRAGVIADDSARDLRRDVNLLRAMLLSLSRRIQQRITQERSGQASERPESKHLE